MRNLIKVGLSTLVIAGSLLVAAPAQAATEHCDSSLYPHKVEVGGDSATVHTNLDPGTPVCVKAGNEITTTYVDWYGNVSNDDIYNSNNKLKAISYYAWGHRPS